MLHRQRAGAVCAVIALLLVSGAVNSGCAEKQIYELAVTPPQKAEATVRIATAYINQATSLLANPAVPQKEKDVLIKMVDAAGAASKVISDAGQAWKNADDEITAIRARGEIPSIQKTEIADALFSAIETVLENNSGPIFKLRNRVKKNNG